MSQNPIIIVSGLPRSGTSLMMQMLAAGGVELITDNLREANEDNPNGYYEDKRVKGLAQNSSWLGEGRGKAVKIISALLYHLPPQWQYKIIFLTRDMNEIISSQEKMLQRNNSNVTKVDTEILIKKFSAHVEHVITTCQQKTNYEMLCVSHNNLILKPDIEVFRLREFLNLPLESKKMIRIVDPNLYRNRQNIPKKNG